MPNHKLKNCGLVLGAGLLTCGTVHANTNQEQFTTDIDALCTEILQQEGAGFDFASFENACRLSEVPDPVEYEQDRAQITPDEQPALYTSLVQISRNQVNSIRNHLSGLRRQQAGGGSEVAIFPGVADYRGGNAGGELFRSQALGLFLSGARAGGDQDDTDYEVGYDLSDDHYTLGADWQLNDEWLVGAAWGHSESELEYNQFGDQTDNQSDHLIVYSSWYRRDFALDTTLGYARGEFDTRRHLPGASLARGTSDTRMLYLSLTGGYDFRSGGWTYGPLASLDYLDGDIDAFEESGDSPWTAAFAKQTVESLIYSAGGQVAYAKSFSWGVLVPYAKAIWRHEFEDDRDLIVGRFLFSPGDEFSIQADDPDTNWMEAQAGASAQFPHGIAAFIDYAAVLDYDDTRLATVSAGVRLAF